MYQDFLGNQITCQSAETAAAIDDFVGGLLAYEARAITVMGAAEADPENCLANAYSAMAWMFAEAPEAPFAAASALARAEAAAAQATRREQLTTIFAEAWVHGDLARLFAIADQIQQEFPRDLVITKLAQYHAFNRGDAPAMLRLAHAVFDANADIAHMHAMRGFAFEQCHLLNEAETDAGNALRLTEREPWAHHCFAHIALARGEIAEGAAFLQAMSRHWTGLNSFMHTHSWWHLALFLLSMGEDERVLAIHDRDIWGIDKSYSQDQVGAVSMLARLELAGVDVGNRWQALADHLEARAGDAVLPFLSMQYLYGLARAERPAAEKLLEAIRARSQNADDPDHIAWAEVALPASQGLLAHARGDHDTARRQLGLALPRMQEIGGSHAQRDLFAQLHLDALIRTDHLAEAQQILELRRAHDPHGVPLNRQLAAVYDRLGLPHEAHVAGERAKEGYRAA